MTDLLVPPAPKPDSPLASEQEAREVAEAAREKEWESPSFVREIFEGSFRLDLVHPFPAPDPADLERARPFMERLERFMRERVDSDMIDREGKIPSYVVQGLGDIGAFGIKIPTEYGGLGLIGHWKTRQQEGRRLPSLLPRLAWKIHSYRSPTGFNVILNCSIAH